MFFKLMLSNLNLRLKVYALLLDATKAFDRVEFTKLFGLLLDRGMDALFVRCLLNMYLNQKLRIRWNNCFSEPFSVKNGVKQGGVISPLLFGIYIDVLIKQLRDSGLGCYMGPFFIGCITYADDVVLLSPTKTGLSKMLDICQEYSETYHLQFNGGKSQFTVFSPRPTDDESINVFGNCITKASSVTHLGHKLYAETRKDDLEGVISSFYRQYNLFRSKFGQLASSIQAELFQRYCSSFYGCLLIPFRKLDRLCVIWRKTSRAVWRLPYRTHCGVVAGLSGSLCGTHMFISRFMTFASAVMNHQTDVVRYVMRSALNCPLSIFKENHELCCKHLGLNNQSIPDGLKNNIKVICNDQCKMTFESTVISELANVQDQLSDTVLNMTEIETIINHLCLN